MNRQVNIHGEVQQWNDTVKEMIQDEEDTIHSIIPETFQNKWIKNMEKKVSLYVGNTFLCSLLVLLLTSLFLLTHQVVTWNVILIKIN